MNEELPSEDAILIQFQIITFPTYGACYTFSVHVKDTSPIRDAAAGIDYIYLTVGQSIDLCKGARLFPKKFTLTYIGQEVVTVIPTNRRTLRSSNIEFIRAKKEI